MPETIQTSELVEQLNDDLLTEIESTIDDLSSLRYTKLDVECPLCGHDKFTAIQRIAQGIHHNSVEMTCKQCDTDLTVHYQPYDIEWIDADEETHSAVSEGYTKPTVRAYTDGNAYAAFPDVDDLDLPTECPDCDTLLSANDIARTDDLNDHVFICPTCESRHEINEM